jgi:uncharacterized protein YdeI (YjbR/CyaY-like superfamily)
MGLAEKGIDTFCPTSRQHWREWLEAHHADKQAVWLIYHKKKAGTPSLTWSEAVDEALCFGWIDSRAKPIDDYTYKQFFCQRKPTSVWSRINKEKVKQLVDNERMTEAGLRCIDVAKQNGSWTILDEVEAGIIPADLEAAFQKNPLARRYFLGSSWSIRRNLLQVLVLAKRPETRQKRITDIVDLSEESLKPDALQRTKKV